MSTLGKPLAGVYAALTTPRDAAHQFDGEALRGMMQFLMQRGIHGFALNGATGEYCISTPGEVARILETASATADSTTRLLCGIGAPDLHGVLENGRVAVAAGAHAVLLPMPYFFPYAQSDLRAFCLEVAERLPIDILLYNLPQFTTGLAADTVCDLLAVCPSIKGIKDSNGSLDLLRTLTASLPGAVRLVGNDSMLPRALQEGICDGVVSGVAGAVPELILPLFAYGGDRDGRAIRRLEEFIAQLDEFPVPWGLKWIAAGRGMAPARFNLPLSESRMLQGTRFQEWFHSWQQD